jgi:hypothetical protein
MLPLTYWDIQIYLGVSILYDVDIPFLRLN